MVACGHGDYVPLLDALDASVDDAPGVLLVVVTDHSVGIRWTMSEAVMQSCHTAQAKDFALNLAQGSNVYYHLTDPRARYDWVAHNALYADQHNRKLALNALMTGVLSAFNGIDGLAYVGDVRAAGKAYPWSKRVGRMRSLSPTVCAFYAIGTQFSEAKPSSLVLDVDRLHGLLPEIDAKEPSLFLQGTLWKVEVVDRRTSRKRARDE